MTATMNLACTTCAQAFAHAGKDAAGLAILFMLAVIIPVISTVTFLIIRMARREKAHFDPQFQDPYDS